MIMRDAEVDAGSTRDEVAGVGDEAVEVVVVGDEMEDEAAEDGAAEAVGVVEGEVIETKNVSNIIFYIKKWMGCMALIILKCNFDRVPCNNQSIKIRILCLDWYFVVSSTCDASVAHNCLHQTSGCSCCDWISFYLFYCQNVTFGKNGKLHLRPHPDVYSSSVPSVWNAYRHPAVVGISSLDSRDTWIVLQLQRPRTLTQTQ